MNLSHWDEYTIEKKQELLGRLSAAIKPPGASSEIYAHTSEDKTLADRTRPTVSMDSHLKARVEVSDADGGRCWSRSPFFDNQAKPKSRRHYEPQY